MEVPKPELGNQREYIMSKFGFLLSAVLVGLLSVAGVCGAENAFDIRQFGAQGDGKTLCTQAIQQAVERCAAAGGGTVFLPPGRWLSGTIFLRSRVTLKLQAGCTLLGSPSPDDYPQRLPGVPSYSDQYVRQSLISGEDLDQVAIRGPGTIDGSGSHFRWKQYQNRPYVIRLVNCRDVLLEDVRLQNGPMWMQHYLACRRLTLRGLVVHNHVSYNNDGLDVDGCSDVVISGCMIDSDDDALCLKSTSGRPCENVTIANCVLSSHCNALKMGTESHGGFQNITITNCTIRSPRDSKAMYGQQRGLAGVALEIVDGGHLERVAVSNLTIDGVTTPIFLRLGDRGRTYKPDMPRPGVGTFRHVAISNIVATGGSTIGCSITGVPGHPLEDVTLSNIQLGFDGGGTKEQTTREVPEREEAYPECKMFGVLPAYGFYCRHAKGLKFHHVQLRTEAHDLRHALVCDDVEDLVIDGLDTRPAPGAAAVVRLSQTQGAWIAGCRLPTPADTFLELHGKATQGVVLLGNELGRAARMVETGAEVPPGGFSVK
jgi:polygalacturonase